MADLSTCLIEYAIKYLHFNPKDQNKTSGILSSLIGSSVSFDAVPETPIPFINVFKDLIKRESPIQFERTVDHIFALLTPSQPNVNQTFWSLYDKSPQTATSFLYTLGHLNHYIQSDKIRLNRHYHSHDLIVTINLSKEEKDHRRVLADMKQSASVYPMCPLCYENVGYPGIGEQPPRETLRVAHMTLDGDPWFMQFSPYPYFEEHAIFIDRIHRPMNVDVKALRQLVDIVDLFPHYFVGCNAAMPITGGSILSHAHFQGGKNVGFPLLKAPFEQAFSMPDYPDVIAETVDWPTFVVRLTSVDRDQLVNASMTILKTWKSFESKDINLIPETDGVPHHGMAAIIHKPDDRYVMHLVLRSNLTNHDYPEGVFHAHPKHHHIKKEGVGLIEALGMFILPGRLASVMDTFVKMGNHQDFIVLKEEHPIHEDWFNRFKTITTYDPTTLHQLFLTELEHVCQDILHHISVFKNDTSGVRAKQQFLSLISGGQHV